VANLPQKYSEKSDSAVSEDYVAVLAARIANGEHPRTIARKLHPHDRIQRNRTYRRLRNIALRDARVASYVAEEARLEMLVGLKPAVAGLVGRAARGRPDAGKIILEASGFHNPRVKHDHSGEIKLTLNIPRPQLDEQVVDADVVE
jgi:hypothetical protein